MSDRLDAAVRELVAALKADLASEQAPTATPRLLDIPEACVALGGLSRAKFYQLLADPENGIRTLSVGRRRLVVAESLNTFVTRQSSPSAKAA